MTFTNNPEYTCDLCRKSSEERMKIADCTHSKDTHVCEECIEKLQKKTSNSVASGNLILTILDIVNQGGGYMPHMVEEIQSSIKEYFSSSGVFFPTRDEKCIKQIKNITDQTGSGTFETRLKSVERIIKVHYQIGE